MVEELLFLIITAQESISFVKFSIKKQSNLVQVQFLMLKEGTNKDKVKKASQTPRLTQFIVRHSINYEGCCKLLM